MQQTEYISQKKWHPIELSMLVLMMSLFTNVCLGQGSVSLAQIKQAELKKLAEGRKAQRKIDAIDEDRMSLANDYRATLKQNTNLKKYNATLEKTIISNQAYISSIQQQIESISNLERDIVPLMWEMLDRLENFIALDLPFLQDERSTRIENLRKLMLDGKKSNSEKYRRIHEAYQIENDYGRTIESYEGKLQKGGKVGKTQLVTFLKIGRLAYLYQSLDGTQSYRWSQTKKQWLRLDDSYNAKIEEGVKMAKEEIPSNLLFVPVEMPL